MLTSRKKRIAIGFTLAATMAASLLTGSANADPAQLSAVVGVGSDTTQDVMNALAGRSLNVQYPPIVSSQASGSRQLISFDAVNPPGVSGSCIAPKVGGPSFNRPNGSSAGRRALSRAIDGTGYGNVACSGPLNVAGLVDYARSSSGPAAGDLGTNLTYVPFARDALTFAFYRAAGTPVTTLTRADLTTLYTTGSVTVGGIRIIPCGIQTSSGTKQFWDTVTTATTGQEASSTLECNNLFGGDPAGRSQENDAAALKARGDAIALVAGQSGTQVVIGFSAGGFVGNSNLNGAVAPAGFGLGSISNDGAGNNLGSPITGTAAPFGTSAAFFDNAVFGRDLYNVFATARIASTVGNADVKDMFATASSKVCLATTTIQTFGFRVSANCGSLAVRGSLLTGQL